MLNTDQNLLQSIASGDNLAYKQLFDTYFPSLLKKAYSLISNKEIAEEIVLDVFLDVWQNRSKIEIKTNLKAYLTTAIKYRCFNELKRKYNSNGHQVDIESTTIADLSSSDAHLTSQELSRLLDRTVDQLPEKSKIVFLMSREEEMTYAKIASELSITTKNVEYHISQSLKIIRKTLVEHGYPIGIIAILAEFKHLPWL